MHHPETLEVLEKLLLFRGDRHRLFNRMFARVHIWDVINSHVRDPWRWELMFRELVPVDRQEPRMLLHLQSTSATTTQPPRDLLLQEALE